MTEMPDILEIQENLRYKTVKELFDDPRYPQIIEDYHKSKLDYKANPHGFTPSMLRLTMIETENKFKRLKL